MNPNQFDEQRPLTVWYAADFDGQHRKYMEQLAPGQRLIGVYDRGVNKVAIDVTDCEVFVECEERYRQGYALKRHFYAYTPESEANDAP